MARVKPNVLKLRKQRRYAVDEIRFRELVREANRRAQVLRPAPESKKSIEQTHFEHQIKDLMGISLGELPSELNRKRRVFLGLEKYSIRTPRDESVWRMKLVRLLSRTELVFRVDTKAMFLIQHENGLWYFLYRDKGLFYKKSAFYDGRSKALDRYENEKISWMEIFLET